MKPFYVYFLCIIIFSSCNQNTPAKSQDKEQTHLEHPNLILTKDGVNRIKSNLENAPLFNQTLEVTKVEVDAEMANGIIVPLPKDMAGGFTHTQHKINYATMQKAGVLFQITGEEKYAVYIKDMLMAYAKIFPTFKKHPVERSYARGKFFWQCLNDSNWLVYTSQAYDCIYSWLPSEDVTYLNKNLFKPYADFLSIENPQYFNRIHNHSTWGSVAVGMIGLVMDDDDLVNRALYGLKTDNIDPNAKDNDGGFIKTEGQKAGFLANLDSPFSPDGYYTEGPYYQRYAMYPFMIFAQALHNKKPELKIFEYKDGLLIKAVNALLNLTDADGEFFPLNDGQKGMSIYTSSLVSAVDIAYFYGNKNKQLLSVAKNQNAVQLDETGFAVAEAIQAGKTAPFLKESITLRDGSNGDEGGISILRHNYNDHSLALVYKYAAQGLSHGHYDKLSFSLYENGDEVLQDYGLSRFVNVEQKNGGGYLKENNTWAKQTIAHNTITQNETSHFNGNFKLGSENHPELYVFDVSELGFQIVSAKINSVYENSQFHRTLVMFKDSISSNPFILDLFRVTASERNKYDLPFHYFGQVVNANFDITTPKTLHTLGSKNGYQHMWVEGEGNADQDVMQFTWLDNNRFYSITSAANTEDKYVLTRMGANDPEFNLRRDPSLIIRRQAKNTTFASIIESHGTYNPVTEKADNAYSTLKDLKTILETKEYTAVSFKIEAKTYVFILANQDASKQKEHKLNLDGTDISWNGPYYFNTIK